MYVRRKRRGGRGRGGVVGRKRKGK